MWRPTYASVLRGSLASIAMNRADSSCLSKSTSCVYRPTTVMDPMVSVHPMPPPTPPQPRNKKREPVSDDPPETFWGWCLDAENQPTPPIGTEKRGGQIDSKAPVQFWFAGAITMKKATYVLLWVLYLATMACLISITLHFAKPDKEVADIGSKMVKPRIQNYWNSFQTIRGGREGEKQVDFKAGHHSGTADTDTVETNNFVPRPFHNFFNTGHLQEPADDYNNNTNNNSIVTSDHTP